MSNNTGIYEPTYDVCYIKTEKDDNTCKDETVAINNQDF